MSREKVYSSCGEYYYFFRLFEDAVKEGGWVRQGGHKTIDLNDVEITHNPANTKLIDNEYGRYIKGGINRYALFVEGNIYIEKEKDFSLTDEIIENEYGDCIILSNVQNEDMLVKNYSSSVSLSYSM